MKTYNIDFGGNLMAQIIIDNDNVVVHKCIDGYGDPIAINSILIEEENQFTENPELL